MISRRLLFAGAPLALAGCASGNQTLTSEKMVRLGRNVALLANALQTSVDQLAANPAIGLAPSTRDSLTTALAGVQSIAAALAKAPPEDDARPLVVRLTVYANTILGTAAMIPGLPPVVSASLAAATILLPVIQIAVGLAVDDLKGADPAPAPVPAVTAPPTAPVLTVVK